MTSMGFVTANKSRQIITRSKVDFGQKKKGLKYMYDKGFKI